MPRILGQAHKSREMASSFRDEESPPSRRCGLVEKEAYYAVLEGQDRLDDRAVRWLSARDDDLDRPDPTRDTGEADRPLLI